VKSRVAIAVRRGLAKDPRCQPNRVDDPELANAEAGVERRLAAHVIAQRGVGDLDDEQHVRAGKPRKACRARIDHDVRLEIGILAETKRCLLSNRAILGPGPNPAVDERDLNCLVASSLRRHRNQLPPDQFDALVLLHHPGRDHRLDLGDSESAARQTLCCRSNPGGRPHD